MRYYVDCEFDGHNGPLLSMALVRENGEGGYWITTETARDPWVVANVVPLLDAITPSAVMHTDAIGADIEQFIGDDREPIIVADSPVDIARFCQAISTAPGGGYSPCIAPRLSFEVHDVDCYPTKLTDAVQHNAWWDAMALRAKLMEQKL
jgi:hypothetical protein